jgi:hypothetical protein
MFRDGGSGGMTSFLGESAAHFLEYHLFGYGVALVMPAPSSSTESADFARP